MFYYYGTLCKGPGYRKVCTNHGAENYSMAYLKDINHISSAENVFSIGFGGRPISFRMFQIMCQNKLLLES